MDDPRFSHIASDPRYKRVPRKRHKVTVDSRFKSMFSDKKFEINYNVDKRGKKISESSKENLQHFYNIDTEDKKDEVISEEEAGQESVDDDVDSNIDREDVVRSDGAVESDISVESDGEQSDGSSSTDLDYDAFQKQEAEVVYDWGELDADVQRSHDTNHRLAVCNMNWDRITAQDLFVLFNSFKPQNGVIKSVKIYLSDYGKERLAKEDIEGPAELVADSSNVTTEEGKDLLEGQQFAREKLRQYQLNRLKYYYAIIECDNEVTAEHIYDQCDGMEYENSASTIDLRFVPKDEEFTDEPQAVATESSVATDFVPSTFFTSALQQTNVNFTWDETDHSRLKKTMKSFSKDELENLDFGAYLGSSSEEELDKDTVKDSKTYRALLGIDKGGTNSGTEEQQEEETGEELQITWSIGLQDKRDKTKKLKGPKKKKKEVQDKEVAVQEDEADDDLGFDDPFFTTNKVKQKHKKNKLSTKEKEMKEKEKEELELLMMSDDDEKDKKHFNLKDISSKNKKESAKKKRKKRKLDDQIVGACVDDFKVDTSDQRFTALYESHHFAVDRTNPQYKHTKGMEEILSEKQKRSREIKKMKLLDEKPDVDQNLAALMKSVKAKATVYMDRKKKRKQKGLIS